MLLAKYSVAVRRLGLIRYRIKKVNAFALQSTNANLQMELFFRIIVNFVGFQTSDTPYGIKKGGFK